MGIIWLAKSWAGRMNGKNKRWREIRWEERQRERLQHIQKKKGIRKMSDGKKEEGNRECVGGTGCAGAEGDPAAEGVPGLDADVQIQ